jgi:hypothetical protein
LSRGARVPWFRNERRERAWGFVKAEVPSVEIVRKKVRCYKALFQSCGGLTQLIGETFGGSKQSVEKSGL